MDCSLPDSSVHGIFQARVLEWSAIAFSEKEALSPTNLPRNSSSWTEIESSQFLSGAMGPRVRQHGAALKLVLNKLFVKLMKLQRHLHLPSH